MMIATHTHTDMYPSAKMSVKCVYTKEWAICTCKPESHLHSSSPLWVCRSYQELCFYLAWGSLQIHNLLFPALQISCFPLFSPIFCFPSPFWGHFKIFWSLQKLPFSHCPVASLLLLVTVIIWFSHFPICCNNFILSHLKEAYRQTPHLMCEQKMRREMMHYSHRLIQALYANQHFKSSCMEMSLRGSWVW